MSTWITPWRWELPLVGPQSLRWGMVPDVLEAMDLRSDVECATAGGPPGNALAVTEDGIILDPPSVEVPPVLTLADRNRIGEALGIDGITATTRRDLILDLFTTHADPMGVTFARPLMPDTRGRLVLPFAGVDFVHRLDPVSPYWPTVQTVIRQQYRTARTDAIEGREAPEFHRRLLTVWQEQFGFADYHLFVPPDLPDESPLPHASSFTDNFTAADNILLSGQQTWTETAAAGDWETKSNTAHSTGGAVGNDVEVKCNTALSSDAHSAQAQALCTGSDNCYMGICVRFSNSARTFYGVYIGQGSAAGRSLFKTVATTRTALAGGDSGTNTAALIYLQHDGSQLQAKANGSNILSAVSDTTISGNVRVGMWTYAVLTSSATQSFDDFAAADLSAGAAGKPWTYYAQQFAQAAR